jgi:hypothetical protein
MSKSLEGLLREAGRRLADWQTAFIFKVPEEWRTTPCDFFGHTADGRAILIEAKEVNRTSLPIGCDPGLQPHQWNALCDANRANCIALICWARGPVCATLTMDMAIALSEGRRSIPWNKIQKRFLHSMTGDRASLTILEPFVAAQCS